jgi:predicted ATPase/DNA-binding SARP family transcriptional activator
VSVVRDQADRPLRGQAAQALVLLVAEYPQRVDVAMITEMLWPGSEPRDVRPNLRVLLHKLRSELGSVEAVASADDTWRLAVEADSIDSVQFESAATEANSLDLASLDAALSLWRGDTAGGSTIDELRGWQTRLETLRLDTEERRLDAMLERGRADAVAAEARILADAQPYRERRWELLVLALYRSGRQREALDAAREVAALLRTDLGIEPGPGLRELEFDVLRQAAHLELPRHHDDADIGPQLLPAGVPGGLIGRVDERARVHELLQQHSVVTITGAGGMGKTALAVAVAQDLADDGTTTEAPWWCDLSNATAEDVAFRIGVAVGVRSGTRNPAELAELLRHRSTTAVVLDNCEHVAESVRATVDAICAAPNVTVLATSRGPLRAVGEHVVQLGALQLGDEATELFGRIASAVGPTETPYDPELVATICEKLDGLPLAIALAASRIRSFSIEEIAERLDRLLHPRASAEASDDRHATMTDAIKWSTDLLSPAALTMLGIMGVFPASFDLAAIEALTGDQIADDPLGVLEELVDLGLVQASAQRGRSRYRLLQPIRQFVARHLNDGTHRGTPRDRDRHLVHYLDRLDRAYEAHGESTSEPLRRLIVDDIENLAGAHDWALSSGRLDDDLRLYRPLTIAHLYDRPEPFRWAAEALAMDGIEECDRYGEALHAAWYGALANDLDLDTAGALIAKLVAIDSNDVAFDLSLLAQALHALLVERDHARASEMFELAPQDDPYVRYVTATVGGTVRFLQAQREGADVSSHLASTIATLEGCLAWARSIGATNFEAGVHERLAECMLGSAPVEQARGLAEQAHRLGVDQAMGHVEAQSAFQLVRCDLFAGGPSATVASQLASVLERGVQTSAQARLRWQLGAAVDLLAAHGARDAAADAHAFSGFVHLPPPLAPLSDDEIADGLARAAASSLLDVAADTARALRSLSAEVRSSGGVRPSG